ncbi:hypothetical protein EGJ27_17705 [Pseudomonas sp. v388]|uniref:Imm32 family immunity protein n=1 Tax=Pseudomonas sp. v388 TaxID=2479849 RepID=UPI000F7B1A21|nr:hypothetical protein [Pseudomonas sp. v388]RRV05649.1 hypothetical protein EGJ27_17705 [Pseudomonas sp. v388]
MKKFSVHGTEIGSEISNQLDEIVVYGSPEAIREIGLFLIHAAYEMSSNGIDHVHLQDEIEGFTYKKHADIIAMQLPAPIKK